VTINWQIIHTMAQFAQINVADNVPTTLRYQFVDTETDEPIELTRFVITVFDIDERTDRTIESKHVCVCVEDVWDILTAEWKFEQRG